MLKINIISLILGLILLQENSNLSIYSLRSLGRNSFRNVNFISTVKKSSAFCNRYLKIFGEITNDEFSLILWNIVKQDCFV